MDPLGCPETSATTNLRCLTSQETESLIYTAAQPWIHAFAMFVMWLYSEVQFSILWHTKSSLVPTLCVYVCNGVVGIRLFLLVHGMWLVGREGCGWLQPRTGCAGGMACSTPPRVFTRGQYCPIQRIVQALVPSRNLDIRGSAGATKKNHHSEQPVCKCYVQNLNTVVLKWDVPHSCWKKMVCSCPSTCGFVDCSSVARWLRPSLVFWTKKNGLTVGTAVSENV